MSNHLEPESILKHICDNALHNLSKNHHLIEPEDDGSEMASEYVSNCSTLISRDINNVKDKENLLRTLEHQLIYTNFLKEVYESYIKETHLHLALDNDNTAT